MVKCGVLRRKLWLKSKIRGSPENLRRAAVNQDIERLKVLAAKPAALGLALSLSLPVNLVN